MVATPGTVIIIVMMIIIRFRTGLTRQIRDFVLVLAPAAQRRLGDADIACDRRFTFAVVHPSNCLQFFVGAQRAQRALTSFARHRRRRRRLRVFY